MTRGVALVTGSARGLGKATARALLQSGFDVALCDLTAPDLSDLSTRTARATTYASDLTVIDEHHVLLDAIERDLGPVVCLVNNAGVSSMVRGDVLNLKPDSFDRSVNVNMRATFFLTQAVAKRFVRDHEKGIGAFRSIHTISSVNAEMVSESRADYCMTKTSLAMMSKIFAARLAAIGAVSYDIRPGIMKTEMTAPSAERYNEFISNGGVPMRRWGRPEDVASCIATLARGDMPFTTGFAVLVDGGMTMHQI